MEKIKWVGIFLFGIISLFLNLQTLIAAENEIHQNNLQKIYIKGIEIKGNKIVSQVFQEKFKYQAKLKWLNGKKYEVIKGST